MSDLVYGNNPEDYYHVSYSQTRAYLGAMWVHPACISMCQFEFGFSQPNFLFNGDGYLITSELKVLSEKANLQAKKK